MWIPIGKSYELGIGKREDWDATRIDVLHSHKIALLGDLFNTLRHELSNPLFGLGLACELLISTKTPEDVSVVLSEIKKNILRSQLIISNLSKLYSEENTSNSCDLGQVLEEALTLAKSELRTIRKVLPLPGILEGIIVVGRPLLVVQILFNLLINSSQAMRDNTSSPEIIIKEDIRTNSVELIIRDNGPGLPLLIRENLFRPFYTTKQKGHGLGLALSRDLALKIGGDLNYIESTIGTTFRLQLKRVK
jgi:C4-dicarboxylate-specific signal transduction histidine kinase